MIEWTEVRKRFLGDKRLAQLYLHDARVLLGEIKTRAGGEGPWRMHQTTRTLTLPNGVTITALSDVTGVTPRDEVIIDVRTLGQMPEKPPVEPEEKYYPYLWVGVREISGGSGVLALAQFDKGGADFLLNFCVFEPGATLPSQTVTTLGAHNYQNDTIEQPFWWNFSDLEFWWSSNGRWTGPDLVYTDRGLFLATYSVASPLSPEYPDTLWQLCAILDPDLKEIEITELSSFVFGGATYAPGAGAFPRVPITSEVVPGDYVVKVGAPMESCLETWPTTYELKAIVGKAPGRIATHTTTFTLSKGSSFFSDWYPGGYNYAAHGQGLYGFGNNRHSSDAWWQGALRIDVLNGAIAEEVNFYPRPEDKPDAWFNPGEALVDICDWPDCLPSPFSYFQEVTTATHEFHLYDLEANQGPWYLFFKGAWVLSVHKDGSPCRVQVSTSPLGCNPTPIGEGEVWFANHADDPRDPANPSLPIGQSYPPQVPYKPGDYVQIVGWSGIGTVLAVSNTLNRSAIEQNPPVYIGNLCPCAAGPNNYQIFLEAFYPKAMVTNWLANHNCA